MSFCPPEPLGFGVFQGGLGGVFGIKSSHNLNNSRVNLWYHYAMKTRPDNRIKLTPETRNSHRAGSGIEVSHTSFDLCNKAICNTSNGELALSTVGSHYIVVTTVDKPSKESRQQKALLELALNTQSTLPELERLTVAINMITKRLDEHAPLQIPGIPSRAEMQRLAQRYAQPGASVGLH